MFLSSNIIFYGFYQFRGFAAIEKCGGFWKSRVMKAKGGVSRQAIVLRFIGASRLAGMKNCH
ncbi:MAG: hypothetical protein CO189_00065 [candidate division Zixibacteria bacterium CG_4_9_14_3_um_filter_46_8]|nr:MAG: hypothetical protein CO189_00065 [candidate division Zixibacteria bacterium CG_4_9_14_3_um_filter_46_8]